MAEDNILPDYEKLASFYLGKKYELAGRRLTDEKVLYDAKDLTTHAMCVGMTGSGKTGLCLSLLEEAALDGIPAICIDPKGDLGNLLLAFPDLAPENFKPWLEESEAARKGLDIDQFAAETATKWREGLESWDQDAARVRRFKDSVDVSIYTPGSNAGIPMTVLKSFDAPPAAVVDDNEVMRERVSGAASGLLTLMGMEADPLTSREHILLANIFDVSWRQGRNLDLPELIRSIQNPPMQKVGVFDLESFFPANDRMKLSIQLNNLLASPAFAGMLEGEPLDIRKLMYTAEGKPRLSIISIAHLSDTERMFFVTILLNELLSWVRTQSGTSSLRALFYMDEVYGYFPPSAKPPSKPPMMVLLKQARAFGLGIALATQNPVDLDYKGLSNIGTWFLGRLQTQRDKDRVLEGLEGAAAQTGAKFDRGAMEQTLAALGSRVFLMNNVHDDGPTIFQTRWAMSFLSGPMSRDQIQRVMADKRTALDSANQFNRSEKQAGAEADGALLGKEAGIRAASVANSGRSAEASLRPIVPNDVEERFALPSRLIPSGSKLVYRPAVMATASVHYVRASADVDEWSDRTLIVPVDGRLPADLWLDARSVAPKQLDLTDAPESEAIYGDLPSELLNEKSYKAWEKDLKDHLYRRCPVQVFKCVELKRYSRIGLSELDARLDWQQEVRELRDREKEELQEKLASKLDSLESKIRTAEQRVAREDAQYDSAKWKTMINFGETLLGAFLGNKIRSKSASTGRSAGYAAQQRSDVKIAQDALDDLLREKVELQREAEDEIHALQDKFRVETLTLEPLEIPCRKGDIKVHLLALLWLPWQVDSSGTASLLCELPEG